LASSPADRAGAAGPGVKIPDETYRVVYLGDTRPILLEMKIRVDDRSLRAAWEGMIDRVFRYLDIDGDGVISKSEAERAPPIEAILGGPFGARGGGQPGKLTALAKDGKITRTQLADYYRSAGLAPFQLSNVDRPFTGVIRLSI